MKRFSTFGLAIAAGTSVLGGCADPGTAPRRAPDPVDTTASMPPTPRPHLLSLGAAYLGMAPRGDATRFPPSVRVLDDLGSALPNVTVNFAIVAGGGTLVNPQATSDANGIAAAGMWLLGRAPGRNVVRATSPGMSDTIFFDMEGVEVDTSRSDGRFLLERLDGSPLPVVMPTGVAASGYQVRSADIEIRGSRFVFTWRLGSPTGSGEVTLRTEGKVTVSGPYLMLEMDGLDRGEYFRESPALLLADGRLRIGNFAEGWPLFGNYQDFRRAP